MRKNKIIYSINIEDVQNVAQEQVGRALTDRELKIIEDKIGDQFDWYEAIASLISVYAPTGASVEA
jgi:nucleoside-triphosphatase THEP1